MVRHELVRNGERVEVQLLDDEHSEPGCIVLEQEDTAIKNKIAKCSARWSMAANRDDQEGLLRWSREWAGISEKLLRFWVQLGCPKLPPSEEERHNDVSTGLSGMRIRGLRYWWDPCSILLG